jgi:hypothetical protein
MRCPDIETEVGASAEMDKDLEVLVRIGDMKVYLQQCAAISEVRQYFSSII